MAGRPALPVARDGLTAWLAGRLGAGHVTLDGVSLLPGGAIQNNWLLELGVDGDPQRLVLRSGPDLPLPESRSKAEEFAMLRQAWVAGAPVPRPLWLSGGELGVPFFVSAFCAGDAGRERLVGRPDNAALLGDLAAALARIHGVTAPPDVDADAARERVAILDGWAQALGVVPPEVVAGLDWLRADAPRGGVETMVHRDFRTGNFLVDDERLVAVLDWEFAGWGDPAEDIGWFCAACWRGAASNREAGGLGGRAAFYDAYMSAGGREPDPDRVRFWEVFAHVRWALIAMQQGARARAGAYPAWELEEAEARVPSLSCAIGAMI